MKNIIGKVYLMLAFSLAGTSVVTGFILTRKLGGFTITSVSLGMMLLCMLPFYEVRTVRTIRLLKRSDWKMLLLQAVFGIFLFRIFLLLGVALTSTAEAGILTGTMPAITSILAYFILREKLKGWTVFGIACTVLGIFLVQGANLSSIQYFIRHIGGNVLVLCAAASESVFNIISRKHRAKNQYPAQILIHPMVQTLLVSAIAFILSIIPAFLEQPFLALKMIGMKEWLAMGWYGLVVTALGFVFFYEGVKRCDAYTTAAFSGMMPLTSMLLSLFLFKERIGYARWCGGFLIMLGMLLIGRNRDSVEEKAVLASSARSK